MGTELAIFGAPPRFSEPLHVGRPNIGDRGRFLARVDKMLDRRWLTNNGPYVAELEARIADDLEVEHCVAVSNATVGLQVAAKALGLTGQVIVPAFTFVASAHALRWIGLEPVLCDVDPRTHNLDPERIGELITPATSAILGVHVWGRPCEVHALTEIADEHELKLFFDAAHAYHGSLSGVPIGNFGDAEVFSFHATKFVNAFEGGAITTNDDALAERLRLARNFGFAGVDQVVAIGTNAKMSEVSAAMALTSLESLPDFVSVNRTNHLSYARGLEDLPGFTLATYDPADDPNYQYVIVEVDEAVAGLSRDDVVRVLGAENVLARRYFYPGCHRMEPYSREDPSAIDRLGVTEALSERVVALPTGTAVDVDDVGAICEILAAAVEHAAQIRAQPVPPAVEGWVPEVIDPRPAKG